MPCIRLNSDDVAMFAKHFLFGLPSKLMQERGGNLMVFRHYDRERGPTDVIIIENKDIFWCRKYILNLAVEINKRAGKLEDFCKYWEKHIKMLEKATMPCKKKKKRKGKKKKK